MNSSDQLSDQQIDEWVRSLIENSLGDDNEIAAALAWLDKCRVALRAVNELGVDVETYAEAAAKGPRAV